MSNSKVSNTRPGRILAPGRPLCIYTSPNSLDWLKSSTTYVLNYLECQTRPLFPVATQGLRRNRILSGAGSKWQYLQVQNGGPATANHAARRDGGHSALPV